ncbi:MAG: ABC transporter substrate-binding protein [Fimbriimonadaceae bacterium]
MKRILMGSAAIVAALIVSVGCSNQGGFSKRTQEGKENVFRYPIVTNPTSLDPGIVQDGDTIDLVQNMYEGLVAYGEQNTIIPILAESWDISEDGRTYTFKIKKGVKFHDGNELTAEDFKWTIERNTEPSFNSETAFQYLTDIVGVSEKLEGRAKEVSGVQVVDPYTLKITIDEPRPYFLGKLCYPVSWAMSRHSTPATEVTSPDQIAGTGPFKLKQFVANQLAVQEAFDDYWGGRPNIDAIERPVIGDAATRLNKYRSGEIDLVMLERQDVPTLQQDPELKDQLKFFPRPSVWFLALNCTTYEPFKDARVRRAVALAVDRDKIVNEILGGVNQIAYGMIPPGVPGFRDDYRGLPYDPETAKRLLAEAGYEDASKMPRLELIIRENRPDIRIVAEAVQSQLSETLKMPITIRTMEWRSMIERINRRETDFSHRRWAADYLDPENFISFMGASYGVENKVNYSNPALDQLTRAGDTEMDEARRLPLYQQAEDIMVNDAAYVPIYFQRDAELISPRVKGLRESVFGHLPHTKVTLGQ